ncbi:MAG: RNA-binding transcriptional accessory protein [Halobacteriovoraceae bacterium]|nr:RNA-binding transcriptional accessory protein [Halobacteriovoraceae bacterium]
MIEAKALVYSAQKTQLPLGKVQSCCELLFDEECTIPFIARYRKEKTGNLDEVEIRNIKDFYEEYLEIEKRRTYILKSIQEQEKLTPELEKKIQNALSLQQLEDLYAPYKSQRKTKAMLAKEKGLEPFANWLLTSDQSWESQKDKLMTDFVGPSLVETLEEAMQGASDIIMENIAHNVELKDELRAEFWKSGKITSSKRKDAESIADHLKFKDFFEFSEPVLQLKDPKKTHRYLAMRRGMSLKVLKLTVEIEEGLAKEILHKHELVEVGKGNQDLIEKLITRTYNVALAPSLDLEIKGDLKKIADEAAINVFGVNLKDLLLQPYLGSKAVLGIDPGIRTGCKVVVIDQTGKFIGDHVIYPFEPRKDIAGSKMVLDKMIEAFNIEYIAIGNGTNGRETLEFVEDYIDAVKKEKTKAVMISEAGASIYSASDIAREEFPDKDVTVRGAISIARRFQDPLAELVKIDPKSIGVGQYQHDVSQTKLKKSLEGVVENCVNFVGVDLNTASAPLLSYISGIGSSVAKNIVTQREKIGGFKNRSQLLEVGRFSSKIFEQSAGFLRIYNGDNPLDGTFIHPETYNVLEKWAKSKNHSLNDLVGKEEIIRELENDTDLKNNLGELTFKDIISALKAPKQDPRSEFKPTEFRKDVRKIDDLKVGQWYTGLVNNITNFGAFVDLGVKESGLLHVSQISNEFVSDPLEKLSVGQELKVRVIEVDLDRKRVSLSCKTDDGASVSYSSSGTDRSTRKNKLPQQKEFKNNAFSGLAGFKVKK